MAIQTSVPLFGTIHDAIGLFNRFREGETFRHYVEQRLRRVVPICCLMLLVSVSAAAGVLLALGQVHRGLALAGVLLMPVVLLGSLFVQAYVFFTWLENRALARRKNPEGKAGMGPLPQVPWILASAVILLPLALLATVAWHGALLILLMAILATFAYAMLDT
ncbi:MAG TPA: hypothetical protein VN747_08795 [Burkholderiales bacterium]|nr:hypothetical protein [Burkholderiales bacterium]